jgi:phosphoribosylformylglycinamidine synthase
MGDAARALDTPVVSGNVSFYNETSGRAIYPTPTIGAVGLLADWERHAGAHFAEPGLAIVLLGENREELGGSAWLALRRGLEAGAPPAVDLAHEARLIDLLVSTVADGRVKSAHDASDGGLAVALAEACFGPGAGVGAEVELPESMRPDALLFGESTGRVLATTADPEGLLEAARAQGVPARRIGSTGGDRLRIAPAGGEAWIDEPLARLRSIWERAIPRRLEVE